MGKQAAEIGVFGNLKDKPGLGQAGRGYVGQFVDVLGERK